MGKCKALEIALNNKLLSSHEHLKKGLFSPTPPVVNMENLPPRANWTGAGPEGAITTDEHYMHDRLT